MTVRRCCICHVNATAIVMEETHLPGDWRCRDRDACRRRVRGTIQSRQLAAIMNERP